MKYLKLMIVPALIILSSGCVKAAEADKEKAGLRKEEVMMEKEMEMTAKMKITYGAG
ncbi:MAG: hypothetical protein GX817_01150, partial [Elusimicrobia bacterium]|nr:hypothetical protein [Elusimicrobiota bacterium]